MQKLMKNKDYDTKVVIKDYEKSYFPKHHMYWENLLIPNFHDEFCERAIHVSAQSTLTCVAEHEYRFSTVG